MPDGGVPTVGLPGYTSPDPKRPVPRPARRRSTREASTVRPPTTTRSRPTWLTVKVEHDFARGVKLQNTTRYGKTAQDYLLTAFTSTAANLVTPDPANPAGLDPGAHQPHRQGPDQRDPDQPDRGDARLRPPAPSSTRVVAGLELTNEKQNSFGYTGLGTLAAVEPLYAPNPFLPVAGLNPVRNGVRADASVNTQSLYAFDTLQLGDKWIFNARRARRPFRHATTTASRCRPRRCSLPCRSAPWCRGAGRVAIRWSTAKCRRCTSRRRTAACMRWSPRSKQPPGTNLVLSTDGQQRVQPALRSAGFRPPPKSAPSGTC